MKRRETSPQLSRRDFLGGALLAGAAATMPDLPAFTRAVKSQPAWLHLAHGGSIHTFTADAGSLRFLGATPIEDFAAFATHPKLPILYVARDCAQWEHLPRGVVSTYAVDSGTQPLRLIAQTPMALSSTGPRSLAVSACGGSLLVASSTGRAWNALALDASGVPGPVAVTRKDAGAAPHGVLFSPREALAAGVDPERERLTLLQPASGGLNILARIDAPHGLAAMTPAWTRDGRYLIAADRNGASLSTYAVDASSQCIEHLHSIAMETPVQSVLMHTADGVLTLRTEERGSVLELWRVTAGGLQRESSRAIPERALSMAASSQEDGMLWLATEDRLLCLPSLHDAEIHSARVSLKSRTARVSLAHQPMLS
ncbi:twin-arginine translocation signal domain-containing protein [Silvibacterium sp.]|uniref:twin-arginine translocation signal domain-containing protein n=1 Tax=Silvibacterium sp. TaxID=1964179 RepID=UPI0039E400B1